MVELPVDTFGVRRSVRTVPRMDHVIHLGGGVIPFTWQATSFERAGKATVGGRDLACQGIAFVALDSAALFLDMDTNITQSSQLLLPLLTSREPPFEERTDWLHLSYTADRTGAYMEPASTVLVLSAVLEGDPLFPAIWRHLLHRFPGAYAPNPCTIGPLGPD